MVEVPFLLSIQKQLKVPTEIFAKFFLRIHVKDEVGAFARITNIFAEHGVGFEKIIQLPLEEKESS